MPFWPTSSGPGPKPLDGSISLKFLLETRLKSESFDTLDDLLRFQVCFKFLKQSSLTFLSPGTPDILSRLPWNPY